MIALFCLALRTLFYPSPRRTTTHAVATAKHCDALVAAGCYLGKCGLPAVVGGDRCSRCERIYDEDRVRAIQ